MLRVTKILPILEPSLPFSVIPVSYNFYIQFSGLYSFPVRYGPESPVVDFKPKLSLTLSLDNLIKIHPFIVLDKNFLVRPTISLLSNVSILHSFPYPFESYDNFIKILDDTYTELNLTTITYTSYLRIFCIKHLFCKSGMIVKPSSS